MDLVQEMKRYIPAFYNIIFWNRNDECSESCRDGKCICIDSEQIGILSKRISLYDTLVMEFREDNAHFINLKNISDNTFLCQQMNNTFEDGKLTFYSCLDKYSSEEWDGVFDQLIELLISAQSRGDDIMGKFESIIDSVPIIYMNNSERSISQRDTIMYLSVYSNSSDNYLDMLFRAIICKTIGCCIDEKQRGLMDKYVRAITQFFVNLNGLIQHCNYNKDVLCMAIHKYLVAWRLYQNSKQIDKIFASNVTNYLDYYCSYLNSEAEPFVCSQKWKYAQWYRLLKKILETINVNVQDFPNVFDADIDLDPSDYDELHSILDKLEPYTNEWCDTLSKIQRAFWLYEDILDVISNIQEHGTRK